jgi:glycosyltransferase involved in cell wall biosynthesis
MHKFNANLVRKPRRDANGRADVLFDDPQRVKNSTKWHLVTSEYPPQPGGVSDYTFGIAAGLANQGDEVHVWCPACSDTCPQTSGVDVHRELGTFSRMDLQNVGKSLDRYPGPRRLLVQWVPHGYGYRSMNMGFCLWLLRRARFNGDQVDLVVHEPYLAFGEGSWRQDAAALVHRTMTIILLQAATRVWFSIHAWESRLRPYALGRQIAFDWLPVPSNISVDRNAEAICQIRRRYGRANRLLIGHFGTYGSGIKALLEPVLSSLSPVGHKQSVVLLGRGSKEFREQIVRRNPGLTGFVWATGELCAKDLSHHISACDLLIQPYPDGVSARRTSVMVSLCHGKPVVTTVGRLSEPLWAECRAVIPVEMGNHEALISAARDLLEDPLERERLGVAARTLYQDHFDIHHVLRKLRPEPATTGAIHSCASS